MCLGYEEYPGILLDQEEDVSGRVGIRGAFVGNRSTTSYFQPRPEYSLATTGEG